MTGPVHVPRPPSERAAGEGHPVRVRIPAEETAGDGQPVRVRVPAEGAAGDGQPVRVRIPVEEAAGEGQSVRVRFPVEGAVGVGDLVRDVTGGPGLSVGDDRVREFLVAVGRGLLRPAVARRHPELASLGFFLRPRELERAVGPASGEHVRVPRGLVFHVPPANVDTVFVYSWALSALMGNRNVVRLSARAGVVAEVILGVLHEALDVADPVVARTQRVVTYDRPGRESEGSRPLREGESSRPLRESEGSRPLREGESSRPLRESEGSRPLRESEGGRPLREDEDGRSLRESEGRAPDPTAELSAACDLRVIWGGDRTVDEIRRHPLAPHARDLAFPDRSSFAVVRAAAWLAAEPATRAAVADGFATDAYWFDQAACSSPGTVFWVGSPGECEAARDGFTACLAQAVARRGWTVDAAMAVEKRVATYGLAADGVASSVEFRGNALAQVVLTAPDRAPRRWLGTGTFAHARLGTLGELAGVVRRKDQTMTHFGFGREELAELAGALGGRGVDRMVPVGAALGFHRVWDGVDLPAEFTRLVTVTASPS
ncbi:acyl-CoA reductase [Nonomuraea sp. NPDC050383]|uniref:acyl-CoA reductase n=1 Tax=Nonomuraea sp. NPDC050383 TaxID=3364362 RepID=UPI0037BDACFE